MIGLSFKTRTLALLLKLLAKENGSRRSLVDSVLAIRRKARIRALGQTAKQNIKRVFPRRFPLSRFMAIILRVNNIAMISFSKICHSESTLNCRSRHICIKLTLMYKIIDQFLRNSCHNFK